MSMRSWIRKLFFRPFGRAAPDARRGFRLTVDVMEDRIAPANVFDNGAATLNIVLGTDENLAIVSSGASYGLTTNLKFANGGVSNTTNDFSPFGGANLKLNASGISRYTTAIRITDSGSGDTVTFRDSGSNSYANNFTVALSNAGAGAITFNGVSTFGGNDALSASTTMNLVIRVGAKVSTSGGKISLASTGANTALIVNGGVASAAGSVTLQATGDITLDAPVVTSNGALTLNADSEGDGIGTLTLSAAVMAGFVQQAELNSSDGATSDSFGTSVALSSDGATAVVGAPSHQVGPNASQGAAYVFTLVGGNWIEQAELTASDGGANDNFGASVAISADGNTVLVGAYFHAVAAGAAYVFTHSGVAWTQQAELTASDGGANNYFGYAVALSGDGNTAVVTSFSSNAGHGEAYVFTFAGATWTQQAELTGSDTVAGDAYGYSVALSGDGNTVAVGAIRADNNQGAAYVYTLAGANWTQQAELTASDGASNESFGYAVALSDDGNTAVVGAPNHTVGANAIQGAAYVFARPGTAWTQQQELTAGDGAANAYFGRAVALSGDGSTAVVGALGQTVGPNPDQGAAYVFAQSGAIWTPQAELTSSDGGTNDQFGTAVAASDDGNTIVVGAPFHTVGANFEQGAAYVFVNSPGSPGGSLDAGGSVTATAAAVDFQGTIASGSVVSIAPSQAGAPIGLGGAPVGLQLTNAALAEISAGLLQIGTSGAGTIFVSSDITAPAGWDTLDLVTGASVIEAAGGGSLTVANLNIIAPAGIGANGQPLTLDVATLTADSSGADGDQLLDEIGTAQLASADALNAGSGTIELDGGAFQLTADDAVASASNLSVQTGATFDLNGQVDTVNTVQLAGGTISDTLGGGILTSTQTIDAQDGAASATLAGSNGLAKTTGGTVTLTGVNTYTGTTTISGGTLSISSDANLGTPPPIATVRSIVLDGGTLQATATFTLDSNRGIALGFTTGGGVAGIIDVVAGSTLTYGGILADNGGGVGTLAKTGSGILVLSGSNTYTGPTLIFGGTLQIGAGGATGSLGAGPVADNAALAFDLSSDATIPNIISGFGSLTQSGSGTTTLANANSYSGPTTVTAGTLADGTDNALPTGTPLTLTSPGAFDLAGFNQTIASLTGSPGSTLQAEIDSAAAYDQLTVSGPTNLGGATLSLVGLIASLVGQVITLIDSTIAINGIFSTLPEGATVTVNGVSFVISYTGDNVTLTQDTGVAPNISVGDDGGIYTGAPFPATATVNGGTALEGVGLTLDYVNTVSHQDLGAAAPSAAGSYDVTASFAGSPDYLPASKSSSFIIIQAATNTTVTPAPSSGALYGQAVTFTATVAPVSPNPATVNGGMVNFYDGAAIPQNFLGSSTVAGGIATFTTSQLTVGPAHSINAVYAGNLNFTSSTGTLTGFPVGMANTSTSVAAAPTGGDVFGESATLTATVATLSPSIAIVNSGTVSFYDGAITPANLLGTSGTVGNGSASISTATLSVALHTIIAVYNGDSVQFNASIGTLSNYAVGPASTATSVSASPALGSIFGAPVTLTANVTANSPSGAIVNGGTVSFYNGTANPANLLGTSTAVANGTISLLTTALPANANLTITAVYNGNPNFATSTGTLTNYVIGKATPTINVSDNGGTYDGVTAFPANASVNSGATLESIALTLDYVNTASNQDLGATAPVAAGIYQVTASFAGSADYLPASNTTLFTIGKATPTISVNDNGGTYDGVTAFPATASVNGSAMLESVALTLDYVNTASNQDLGATAPVAAGSYKVTASFAGSADYLPASNSTTFTIGKATPTISVNDNGGTYDGATAFPATTTVNGSATLESVGLTLDYVNIASNQDLGATAPVAAGSYQVTASFAGSADYLPASNSTTFTIGKATPTISVSDNGGTYDGVTAFPATVSVNGGATLESVGVTLDYINAASNQDLGATAPVAAGSYQVTASFAGSADYLPASNSTTFTIGKATPTISVSDNGGTYDGVTAFPATVSVNGGATLETVGVTLDYVNTASNQNLGAATPVAAGSYQVTASFAGSADFLPASNSTTFTIGAATPTISINDNGGTYDGVTAFLATASVNGGATLETVGVTLDYVNTASNQDLGAAAPVAAGSYKVTASFAGSADYLPASNSTTFTIGAATPTISVNDNGGTYDGVTAFPATASVNGGTTLESVGVTLDYINTASNQDLGAAAPVAAGSYKVTASFAGSADYLPANNSTTFTIGKATPTISVSDNGGTYDGVTAFPATASVNGGTTLESVGVTLDYINTASNQDLGAAAPVAAGNYKVTASFAGSADYLPASNSTTFTIGAATPTISVNDNGGTYDGVTAFPATVSVNGGATLESVGVPLDYVNTASNQDLGATAPVAAGSYQVTASFAGSADYLPASNSTTFTIGKATPTISVSDNGGTYDGVTAFPATVSVNGGATLESVGVPLDYVNTASNQDLGATAPVAAGSYQVTASFAGSADYLPASNSTTFTIGKATPTISVSDNGGTYDGVTAFPATVSVNGGATLESVGVTLDYINTASNQDLGATAPVAAGSYQVTASFAGSADYLPASNSTTFTIGKATPTISVSDNGGTYDGVTAFPATVSVNGGATLESVGVTLDYINTASNQDLGATAPVAAGGYQVTASFAGSADYLPASNSTTFTIGKATPTISVNDNGGTYDGATAFPATASVNGGATLESVALTLDYVNTASNQDLGATAPVAAGSYQVTASFAGSADYLPASNSTTFTIGKATPTISVSDNGGTYDGATAFPANAGVNGGAMLESVALTLDYVNTASNQNLGATAPVAAGSYQVTASFAGSADYLPASNSTTFTIGAATPTISVNDNGGTYDGVTAFPATVSVNGGATLESVGVTLDYVNTASNQDLGATAPVAAGSYQVTASFAGSADYLPASNSTTFTIGKATPTISVSDNGGTYDGATAFPATVSVNGGATLESVGVTLDYVNTASNQDLGATAPVAAGSYQVTASFAGSADYLPASNSTTFTIGKATPTISVSDNGGTYDGVTAFPATVSVNGGATLETVGVTLDYVNTASNQNLGVATPVAAGSYQVTASFAGSADFLPASNSTTFTIGAATPTISVNDNGGTYDGVTAFPATASVNGGTTLESVGVTLDYINTASNQDLGAAAPVAAGSYKVTASFAGSADYLPASNSTTFTIGAATPTISVNDNGGTYDGVTAFPATASVNGGTTLESVALTLDYVNTASNQDLGATAPVAAGSYQVTASFAGSADFLPASNSTTFTIGAATPTISVNDNGGTYDGVTAFLATASVNGGATLETVGVTLDYVNTASNQDLGAAAPVAAGSYQVTASFAGSADYLPARNSTTFTIGAATPTISVNDNGGTYDGVTAFPATVSVNGGTTLESVALTLDYVNTASNQDLGATAPVAAGSYQVTASFAGSADYLPASNSTTFTIGKATPTISVSDNGGTYDGATAFPATTTVNGSATLESVGLTLDYVNIASNQDLGATAPIAAGSYQVTASFAGSADYLPASNSTTFTIGKATPTISVSDNGGTYDGVTAFPANASVNGGATLETVGLTLDYLDTVSNQDLGATAPVAAGSYQVTASFAGAADYLPAGNSTTFTIGKATPAVGGTDDGATGIPVVAGSPVALLAGPAPSNIGVRVGLTVAPRVIYLSAAALDSEFSRVALGIPQSISGGEPASRVELTDVVRRDVFGLRDFTDSNVLPAAMLSEPSSWSLAGAVRVPLSLANASLEGDDSVFLVEMLRQRARAALETSEEGQETRVTARAQEVVADPTPADDTVSRPVLLTGIVAIPVTAAFAWVAWRYWDRLPALRRRLGLPDAADLVKLQPPSDTGK